MIFFNKNIRSWLGQHRFMKEVKKFERKPEVINFDEAGKIGLIYNATDENNSEIIKNYIKTVRSNYKKDILAMGYVDRTTLHKSQYAQFGIDYFTLKDLNFSMIPNSPVVLNFMNEKFDILINLNSEKCFPLLYISAMSNAKFRVGRFTPAENEQARYLDMMVKPSGETELRTVLGEIEHFLRLIKKT